MLSQEELGAVDDFGSSNECQVVLRVGWDWRIEDLKL
jgi:hypothetical protein